MIPVQQSQYIYPPRPNTAMPREQSTQLHKSKDGLWDSWRAQLKFNDTRCIIKLRDDGAIELWNRHAQRLSYNLPVVLEDQIRQIHSRLGAGYHLLDGGLIHHKHRNIKDTLVVWDLLVSKGLHLIGTPYMDRYDLIRGLSDAGFYTYRGLSLGHSITQDIFMPVLWGLDTGATAWNVVDEANSDGQIVLEGLVLKDMQAQLQFGFTPNNNSSSMIRSRITTLRHVF